MMQGMMQGMTAATAAMQQGQGMSGMQANAGMQPGMQANAGMQQMPGMQPMAGMPHAAGMQVPGMAQPGSLLPSPAQTEMMEKTEAINKCVENLSEVEKEYYAFLWTTPRGDAERLEGKAAFDFFPKS